MSEIPLAKAQFKSVISKMDFPTYPKSNNSKMTFYVCLAKCLSWTCHGYPFMREARVTEFWNFTSIRHNYCLTFKTTTRLSTQIGQN